MSYLAVVCCGCRSILGKDGGLVKHPGGIVAAPKRPHIWDFFRDFPEGKAEQCALFEGAEDANACAMKAGWQISDSTGPNHRCPECLELERQKQEPRYTGRGALVEFEKGRSIT